MTSAESIPGGGRAAARRAANGGRRKQKPARKGVKRWLKPVALSTGLLVIAGCGGGYLYIKHLDSNIKHAPPGAGNAPPPAGKADAEGRVAMNILIIGTDSRKGLAGQGFGDAENTGDGNNDVNIVLHIYPDKKAAVALDLPRDSLIDHPQCKGPDGKIYKPMTHRPLNEAMGRGGPGCVQDTVQKLTNLKIDHFAVVNFQGVRDLTNAVGGVDVNLCTAIKDKDSHLDLSAGPHRLNGDEGLEFVRTRHGVQDGTAIGRFSMQRAFLSSLLRSLTAKGTLLDPTKAFPVIEAATKSITVDDPIAGTTKLVSLASSLKNIKPSEVTFVQPVTEFSHDEPLKELQEKNRLVQPQANDLFALILADKSLSGNEDHSGGTSSPSPSPSAPATSSPPAPNVNPDSVTVTVINGTVTEGLASAAVKSLTGLKYHASTGSGAKGVSASTVHYAQADQQDAARAVAAALGLPDSAVSAGGSGRGVVVTLGTDYHQGGGTPSTAVPTALPTDVKVHQADEDKCTEGRTGVLKQ